MIKSDMTPVGDQSDQRDQQAQPPRFMADELGNLQVPAKQADPHEQSVLAAIRAVVRQARAAQAPAATPVLARDQIARP